MKALAAKDETTPPDDKNEAVRALLANSPDDLFLLDKDSGIHFSSSLIKSAEITGRRFTSLLHTQDQPNFTTLFEQLLKRPGETLDLDVHLLPPYPSDRIYSLRAKNCLHQPAVDGVIVSIREITQRKLYEAELRKQFGDMRSANDALRQQNAQLQERNNELDAFSHTVAHDLKTPLQVVLGYANLLRTDAGARLTPKTMDAVYTIEAYANKMNTLISDLLLLATAAEAEAAMLPINVTERAQAALARYQDTIEAHNIDITLEEPLPEAIAHGPWVEEIFANLIENAIKYRRTQPTNSLVRIKGRRLGQQARYEVIDNGLGIKPADQPNLFKMFYRLKSSQQSGSGLGLSIVQRMVRRMNGSVGVESRFGSGSRFWFTLPSPPDSAD